MAQSSQRCEFNDRTKEACLRIFSLLKTNIVSENVSIVIAFILLISLSWKCIVKFQSCLILISPIGFHPWAISRVLFGMDKDYGHLSPLLICGFTPKILLSTNFLYSSSRRTLKTTFSLSKGLTFSSASLLWISSALIATNSTFLTVSLSSVCIKSSRYSTFPFEFTIYLLAGPL